MQLGQKVKLWGCLGHSRMFGKYDAIIKVVQNLNWAGSLVDFIASNFCMDPVHTLEVDTL